MFFFNSNASFSPVKVIRNLQSQVSDLGSQVSNLQTQLINSQSETKKLQTQLSTFQKEKEDYQTRLAASELELASLREQKISLQTEAETRKKQLEMLYDYSKIPNHLYEGKNGIRSGGLGSELKTFLTQDFVRKPFSDEVFWQQIIMNIINKIVPQHKGLADHFSHYDDYQNVFASLLEFSFNSKAHHLDGGYLFVLRDILLYVHKDVSTRLPIFFNNIKLIILEMLAKYPPES